MTDMKSISIDINPDPRINLPSLLLLGDFVEFPRYKIENIKPLTKEALQDLYQKITSWEFPSFVDNSISAQQITDTTFLVEQPLEYLSITFNLESEIKENRWDKIGEEVFAESEDK